MTFSTNSPTSHGRSMPMDGQTGKSMPSPPMPCSMSAIALTSSGELETEDAVKVGAVSGPETEKEVLTVLEATAQMAVALVVEASAAEVSVAEADLVVEDDTEIIIFSRFEHFI